MLAEIGNRYRSCFISAPFGLDLGELPAVLADHGITWEWARESTDKTRNGPRAIRSSDFFVGVLNSSQGDIRVLYEAGIAVGLNKPVLFLLTKARPLPLDREQFALAKVSLKNRAGLAFQLKLFLAAPPRNVFDKALSPPPSAAVQPPTIKGEVGARHRSSTSELESRVLRIVEESGGSVIAQPRVGSEKRFVPDLLVWLAGQEPDLLDPAVIEVKHSVERADVRKVEQQLVAFMVATGVRTGLVVTESSPPKIEQQLSPNVFWLDVGQFENLVRESRLGVFLRDMRNRALHGTR